jgi:hypothetical protein
VTFAPGQSGNPGGRRKEKPYRDALRLVLAEQPSDTDPPKPKTKLEAVVRAHVQKARDGDYPSIQGIADRLDGKVPQALIGSDDPDDTPVQFQLVQLVPVDPKSDEPAG